MQKLSKFGNDIVGSEIIKISQKVKSITDKKIYNYSIGDFDPHINPIPTSLKLGIIAEYIKDETNYPLSNGVLPLREAISEYLDYMHNIKYNTNEILVGAGVRPLIYTMFKTLINPGDKVLYPVPSWNNNHYSFLSEAEHIKIECTPENDFFPTFNDIKANVSELRMICLCSPQNPTGKIISRKLLKQICDLVVEENKRRELENTIHYDDITKVELKPLYLFFDQIYADLDFTRSFHNPIELNPAIKDYLISMDGISKSLCATGVRVGWMFSSEHIIKKATEILSHIGAWAPKPEQIAVSKFIGDLDNPRDFAIGKRDNYKTIINHFITILHENQRLTGNVDYLRPDGGIYISVRLNYIDKFNSLDDMMDYMINECGVAMVPFEYFGCKENKGWFRLSIGSVDVNILHEHTENLNNMILKLENYGKFI